VVGRDGELAERQEGLNAHLVARRVVQAQEELDPAARHLAVADDPGDELCRLGDGERGDARRRRRRVEEGLKRDKVRLEEALRRRVLLRVGRQLAVSGQEGERKEEREREGSVSTRPAH